MTLQYRNARVPGSLGMTPGTSGGRIPGPLRFEHVDVSKGTATKAVSKTFAMPAPASGSSTIIRARVVSWNLSKDSPLTGDVLQGELANCPVAAILAALAHTAAGKRRINNMITEYTGASVTTTFNDDVRKELSSRINGDPDYAPPDQAIASKRYFSVTLGSTIDVSDVFYIRYSDGTDVDMIYMGSPKQALWPCVIEKAYASKIGSYQDLDDPKHTVNEFWAVLVGSKPQVIKIDKKTDVGKIIAAAKAASAIPTIGASNDDATRVESDHGFAILGMQGSNIELFNPHGRKEKISPAEFRDSFEAIYFGNP